MLCSYCRIQSKTNESIQVHSDSGPERNAHRTSLQRGCKASTSIETEPLDSLEAGRDAHRNRIYLGYPRPSALRSATFRRPCSERCLPSLAEAAQTRVLAAPKKMGSVNPLETLTRWSGPGRWLWEGLVVLSCLPGRCRHDCWPAPSDCSVAYARRRRQPTRSLTRSLTPLTVAGTAVQ